MQKKRITFIQPNLIYIKRKRRLRIEPTIYSKLKWLTPDDFECELIDARMEDVDFDIKTDLVVMSVSTLTSRSAYSISAEFRRRGIPVVLGGCHVTLCPEEAMENADAVCLGESEITWPKVLEDFKNNNLQKIYKCDGTRYDFHEVKADRSIYKRYKYVPISSIEFSRGCKFNCEFCSYAPIYKQQVTYRNPEDVAVVKGFINMTEDDSKKFYDKYGFAMDMEDLKFCQKYFRDEEKRDPTITEMKMIDTYWSDHCRHTTFLSKLEKIEINWELANKIYKEYKK